MIQQIEKKAFYFLYKRTEYINLIYLKLIFFLLHLYSAKNSPDRILLLITREIKNAVRRGNSNFLERNIAVIGFRITDDNISLVQRKVNKSLYKPPYILLALLRPRKSFYCGKSFVTARIIFRTDDNRSYISFLRRTTSEESQR